MGKGLIPIQGVGLRPGIKRPSTLVTFDHFFFVTYQDCKSLLNRLPRSFSESRNVSSKHLPRKNKKLVGRSDCLTQSFPYSFLGWTCDLTQIILARMGRATGHIIAGVFQFRVNLSCCSNSWGSLIKKWKMMSRKISKKDRRCGSWWAPNPWGAEARRMPRTILKQTHIDTNPNDTS